MRQKNLLLFPPFYSAPGFTNEKLYYYIGENLVENPLVCEDTHEVDVVYFSIEKLMEMVQNGTIHDAKTIIGILMLAKFKRKLL